MEEAQGGKDVVSGLNEEQFALHNDDAGAVWAAGRDTRTGIDTISTTESHTHSQNMYNSVSVSQGVNV